MDTIEEKPTLTEVKKTSMEILSELFGTFDAEPPVIVKKEKEDDDGSTSRKHKKSKKKHKHKEKKHKKKKSKRKRTTSNSNDNDSELDLAKILIKQEKDKNAEQKIKIEGTSFSIDIPSINFTIKQESKKIKPEKEILHEDNSKSTVTSIETDTHCVEDNEKAKISKFNKHKIKHRKYKRKRNSYSSDDDIDDHSDNEKRWSDSNKEKSRSYIKTEMKKHFKMHHEDIKRKRIDDYRNIDRDRYYLDRSEKFESRSRHKDRSPVRYYGDSDSAYKSRRLSRHRSAERLDKNDKWFLRDRYRGYSRERHSIKKRYERSRNSPSESEESRIDKKKLLEIARKNAINMMKSDKLPEAATLGYKAQEKMIAAIKSGGKTIEELTEFCKSLSKKEEMGELSSLDLSDKDGSDDEQFHHPFQVKERPVAITMNIKNSIPLPTKTTQERTTELRMQFPVSSGQQHRVNEEWIPVSPSPPPPPPISVALSSAITKQLAVNTNLEKKNDSPVLTVVTEPHSSGISSMEVTSQLSSTLLSTSGTAAVVPLSGSPTVPLAGSSTTPQQQPSVDITTVISQRLMAMRRLQENPNDVQALSEIYKSNKEMQNWAQSKQQPGQFTGSTGVQVLSPAALASGAQAWAKRDQLQNAAPVSGGMGMHLLQKMGWKPGEGLGKEKTGALEPLLLEVKLDKKGLVANEENKSGGAGGKKKAKVIQTVKSLQGKHPVSLLGEYASKRKLGLPEYILEFECGPDHKKNFLFKVILNGVEYKPNVASPNKKEAKANAASVALQQIGLLT